MSENIIPCANTQSNGKESNVKESTSSSNSDSKMRESIELSGHSCLLRLIESQHFNPSIALQYIHKIAQRDVAQYIGKKLFECKPIDIAWYLMQLIHLYLHSEDAHMILYEHLRTTSSIDIIFSLTATWLLEAYLLSQTKHQSNKLALLKQLLNSILSYSCSNELNTNLSLFISERSFITELVLISRRLKLVSSKATRVHRLHSELFTLDRTLSHAVYIPILSLPEHVIVRIPFRDASILNSKDKAPYLVYFEVIEQEGATKNFSNIASLRKEEFRKFVSDIYNYDYNGTITEKNEVFEEDDSRTIMSCEVSKKPTWIKLSVDEIRRKIDSVPDYSSISNIIDTDDPSATILSERWEEKMERIRASSPFGHISGWNLYSIIIKYGDDLRQDYLAYQFLKKCQDIWQEENLSLWVRPYPVVITESQAGIIEAISNAVSIHQIKSRTGLLLDEYFRKIYGSNSETYFNAKREFIRSLAGYSIFQYIFQIKDRHNGNILLDSQGHIIHIDFGYILGQSPKNISFETSPFKMTFDFIQLMEGRNSDMFMYFKSLMFHGFMSLRKHMSDLMILVEIMKIGDQLPCLGKDGRAVEALQDRFLPNFNDDQVMKFLEKLIYQSTNSLTTLIYDKFQYYTNGIRT